MQCIKYYDYNFIARIDEGGGWPMDQDTQTGKVHSAIALIIVH